MKFKCNISLVVVVVLMICLISPTMVDAQEKDTTSITILGTSDVHGRIFPWDYALDSEDKDAGYLKIASVVREQREKNPNVVLIDAGDTIQDNSIELFQSEQKNPIIEVMNDIGYDTWTLGNHEFNFGLDVLNKAVKSSKATVLAGNIYKDGKRAFDAYKIVEKDGVKIAIIGMITPNVPRWEASTPDHIKGLEFRNPVDETKKVISELNGKADIFIGSFHMGLDNEYTDFDGTSTIIKANPQLSACIMGHAHSKIEGEMVGDTIVAEPGSKGSLVAKIDLDLKKENGKWKVVSKKCENIDVTNYEMDKQLENKYSNIHKKSRDDANTVIGTVSDDFIKDTFVLDGIPTSQVQDTALIDLINEVQMHYSNADVSAAAAFKSDMNLLKGDFKKKDVANIYKFPNTLMAVKMNGKELKNYIEWSAKYYNTYKSGDVTISFNENVRGYNYDMFSGIEYDIDISKPEGDRVKNLTFKGKPVTDDMVLTVAMNNYRFGNLGKDGYLNPENKVYDSSDKFADGSIRTLIGEYVKEHKTIKPKVDNNWKIIGADLNNPYKEQIYNMVKEGKIKIPTSEDGRTPNVKALNVNELKSKGVLNDIKIEEKPVDNISTKAKTTISENIKDEVKTEVVNEKVHIVKKGDSLWKISKQYNVDLNKIIEINNIKNPNFIQINQQIILP